MHRIISRLGLEGNESTGLLTLLGSCFFMMGSGIIFSWGAINVYFYSYYKNTDSDFSLRSTSIIFSFLMAFIGICAVSSMQIAPKIGFQRLIRICGITYIISIFLCCNTNSFTRFSFFYLATGTSSFALSAIPILSCVWSHFPTSVSGKVTGYVITSLSISAILTVFAFTAIINPDNLPPTIPYYEGDQTVMLFDERITSKLQSTLLIINIIQGIFLIPGIFMITKKDTDIQNLSAITKESDLNEDQPCEIDEDEVIEVTSIASNFENQQIFDGKNLNLQNNTSKQQYIQKVISISNKGLSLKQSVFSLQFIILYSSGIVNSVFIAFLAMNFKIWASSKISDDFFLTIVLISGQIIGAASNIFFGTAIDKFAIHKVLIAIQVVLGMFASTISFVASNRLLLFIWYTVISTSSNGLQTTIGPILIKLFGMELGSSLLPIHITSLFFAIVLIQVINYIVFTLTTYDVALTTMGIAIFFVIFILLKLKQ